MASPPPDCSRDESGFSRTTFSQTAWLPTLRLLKMQIWFGDMLWVGQAMKAFDSQGALTDESIRRRLTDYMAGYCRFVRAMKAGGVEPD